MLPVLDTFKMSTTTGSLSCLSILISLDFPLNLFLFICARGIEVWIIISDLLTDGTNRQMPRSFDHIPFLFHLSHHHRQGRGLCVSRSLRQIIVSVGETNRDTHTGEDRNIVQQQRQHFRWGHVRLVRRRVLLSHAACQGQSCNPWPHSWRIR